MKIAIVYVCTGKYSIFWRDFYLSCEKNFITEAEKDYFVFTDSQEIDFEKNNTKIHRIPQQSLGWPKNTLMRYEMFLTKEDVLKSFDYIFFFNANLIFLEKIKAQDFLPFGDENFTACLHSYYYKHEPKDFTYERNPKSMAYIPKTDGKYYFQGAINGGKSEAFLKAIREMNDNIKKDLANNIISVWWDESHWNKYLLNRHDIKILQPSYLFAEGYHLPFKPIILMRNKGNFGGHSFLRDIPVKNDSKLKITLNRIINFIFR